MIRQFPIRRLRLYGDRIFLGYALAKELDDLFCFDDASFGDRLATSITASDASEAYS